MSGDVAWATIPALLRDAAERDPDGEAVVDGDTRLSFGDLAARAVQAARAFVAHGVEPGDRVAVWAPNTWEWVVALLGLQSAGAVLVPLNTRYKGTEAGHILARSRARLLVTVDGFCANRYVELLREANGGLHRDRPVAGLAELQAAVVLRDEPPDGTIGWDDFLAAGEAVAPAEIDRRVGALSADDISDLLFTSGTTGAPKGVVCTHGQTLRAFAAWAEVIGLRATDRYLIVNPFFHAFGYKAGIVASLIAGATMMPIAAFDEDDVLGLIAAESITMLPGPPTLYQSLLAHPLLDTVDHSTLRLAVTGAAVIPVHLVEQLRFQLGFETVITGYGLTEASGIVTMCRHDDDAETIATTSGRAIPGVEVRTLGEDGAEVAPGQPGEVVVRGYNVMSGYFEDPAQTAEVIDSDGWLRTGDIGVLDDRGYLAITDRKKDMFIVGGFNAYPAEIEQLLLGHPDVAQVAVVGVADERLGEVGVAFVVPRAGTRPHGTEVIAWARDHLANFKVPRRVEVVDALPLNTSGKVGKDELRRRAAEGGDA
ncbi:FadD3 family acyl-CoA ligase [soil metagenome]